MFHFHHVTKYRAFICNINKISTQVPSVPWGWLAQLAGYLHFWCSQKLNQWTDTQSAKILSCQHITFALSNKSRINRPQKETISKEETPETQTSLNITQEDFLLDHESKNQGKPFMYFTAAKYFHLLCFGLVFGWVFVGPLWQSNVQWDGERPDSSRFGNLRKNI